MYYFELMVLFKSKDLYLLSVHTLCPIDDGSWHKFANILDQNQKNHLTSQDSNESNEMYAADIDNTVINDKYKGLHVTFPLTPKMVTDIVEHFKKGKVSVTTDILQTLFW